MNPSSMIPDMDPSTCKWVISGLLGVIGFLVWMLKSTVAAWREDKVYYQNAITRLENIIDSKGGSDA
jgi:hypothetical protein